MSNKLLNAILSTLFILIMGAYGYSYSLNQQTMATYMDISKQITELRIDIASSRATTDSSINIIQDKLDDICKTVIKGDK